MATAQDSQDPYKYFKSKFQGTGAAQGAAAHSDSVSDEQISATDMNQMEVAQDKFDEADSYSMNDDDFQLSGTHNNKTLSPLQPRTPGTVGRGASVLTEEQKAEKAKRMADEEFRRIQAQIDEDESSSTPSAKGKGGKPQQTGYDYFLAKQKKEVGEDESSEHDDYSRASESNQATMPKKQVNFTATG